MSIRKYRNITVCVSPEIYRQTRHLAVEYETSISGMVAWLLPRLPDALKRTRYPIGGPQRPTTKPAPIPDAAASPTQSAETADTAPAAPHPSVLASSTSDPSVPLVPRSLDSCLPPPLDKINPSVNCETVTPSSTSLLS